MPLPPHVSKAADLVTSPQATTQGFLRQTVAKAKKARPYIKEAVALQSALSDLASIEDAIGDMALRDELCAAAGFSDKSLQYFSNEELDAALGEVLQTIAKSSNGDWRQEIVFRYLLTRGDSLGGSMRNLTGALASQHFNTAVIAQLRTPVRYSVDKSKSGKVQIIEWDERFLVFDKTPDFISNSIDVILLKRSHADYKKVMETPKSFLACGELKGGVDPAGADEHWKTANSALRRIRRRFAELKLPIRTFFVGAAIEEAMSEEIFAQLENETLSNAANFTVPSQLSSLAAWLVSL